MTDEQVESANNRARASDHPRRRLKTEPFVYVAG